MTLRKDQKKEIDVMLEKYLSDAVLISKRIDFLIENNLGQRSKGLPPLEDLYDLEQTLMSTMESPVLTRLTTPSDEGNPYIWGQREIGIVLGRDQSTASRTLKKMAASGWRSQLDAVRKEISNGVYLYTVEVFDVILDFYTQRYIKTRIVEPRAGNKMSNAEEEAVWQYWRTLRKEIPSWSEHADKKKKEEELLKLQKLTAEQNQSPPQGQKYRIPNVRRPYLTADRFSLVFADEDLEPIEKDPLASLDMNPEITFKSIISDCATMIIDNKGLSLTMGLAVGIIDIYKKTGEYIFYALIIILIPALFYLFGRLKSALPPLERARLSKFTACFLIAIAAWCLAFGARVVNGNLSQSAFPAEKLNAKIRQLDKNQKATQRQVDNLDKSVSSLEKKEKEQIETIKLLAAQRAEEAKKFVRSVMKDSKKIDGQEFQRIITACENSIASLDFKQHVQRASLYIAIADVYLLWGIQNRSVALSKFEAARTFLNNVINTPGYIMEEQLALAYMGLGDSYLLEADIRSKSEMLEKAMIAYEKVNTDILSAKDKSVYYSNRGQAKAATAELLGTQKTIRKKELLEEALEDCNSALEFAGITEDADYLFYTAFSAIGLIKRQMIGLQEDVQRTALVERMCYESIEDFNNKIIELDPEKDQRLIVHLRLQNISFYLQLYDIKFAQISKLAGEKDLYSEAVVLCENLLSDAMAEIKAVYAMNGAEERFVNAGNILVKEAMVHYRLGVLSANYDKKKEKIERAIELYNKALEKIPETDNLQQNMFIAANKAITLYKAGILFEDKELLKEARDVCEYYLKYYENTGKEDTLTVFKDISTNSPKLIPLIES